MENYKGEYKMPSIFLIKGKIENPMEWYSKKLASNAEWKYDEESESYHTENIYMTEYENGVSFEDMSEEDFFAWETSSWLETADGMELIYGYYNDDNGSAEFVHIKDGKCIRDFREYDFEIETDEGNEPEFTDWTDVAEYVDENLL